MFRHLGNGHGLDPSNWAGPLHPCGDQPLPSDCGPMMRFRLLVSPALCLAGQLSPFALSPFDPPAQGHQLFGPVTGNQIFPDNVDGPVYVCISLKSAFKTFKPAIVPKHPTVLPHGALLSEPAKFTDAATGTGAGGVLLIHRYDFNARSLSDSLKYLPSSEIPPAVMSPPLFFAHIRNPFIDVLRIAHRNPYVPAGLPPGKTIGEDFA